MCNHQIDDSMDSGCAFGRMEEATAVAGGVFDKLVAVVSVFVAAVVHVDVGKHSRFC